ncbi:vacuolar sorting protein Did2 [Schizosaccharomyces japonicus yFS275]|uniref:Vacuolar sorting protein Did2 n=1 Tax=Schizosaccharomyces japonicus (strain yFS275 / FY16936) TaxID=402676 RepID=B6JWX5_SCHJY|nr:vacuolar sorting protein Did2 [Schizosaccharomyces japonicus yFS275]EEB05876.2 vacuolar sorting protein Did2 [Schizosaccharomyces japonicus yFS275]
MSGLENSLFQLKFAAKSLKKQSQKAVKEEKSEKAKIKKAMAQGNTEIARIYATNAIRKQQEALNLLRLSSRIDAVSSRIQTAVTMRNMSRNMSGVVREMDRATRSMNLEMISRVMDRFETQFDDINVQAGVMEKSMGTATAVDAPQEDVDLLLQSVADEAGLELNQSLNSEPLPQQSATEIQAQEPVPVKAQDLDDLLQERLKALRS